MMFTTCCPGALLCTGLIHLVVSRVSCSILESCLIILFSASMSGLYDVGMYSISTVTALSFTTDLPPIPVLGVSTLHYSTRSMEGSEWFRHWLQLMRCA